MTPTSHPPLILLFLAILLTLAGCTEKPDQEVAREEKITVGFLLKTMQEERYALDRSAFIARARDLEADVLFDSAGNDENRQMAIFDDTLNKGARVIVLQPVNTSTAGAMVRRAHARGDRVVGYDFLIMGGPLDIMIMQDSWAVGRLQAESMMTWFRQVKGKVEGKVALIMGQPGDANAQALSSGALEVIHKHPGLTLVTQQSHEAWSPEKAMPTTEYTLRQHHDQVDAFICNNSGLARGVLTTLTARGLAGRVFVAGADADLYNIRAVARGRQTVEVWKRIRPLADRAAEVAVLLARNPRKKTATLLNTDRSINNGFMNVPTIFTPVTLVTRDNIKQTVIAEGLYTREQVYGP